MSGWLILVVKYVGRKNMEQKKTPDILFRLFENQE